MIISLYYVEGISEIDTPYFSCLEEQSLYFANKLVKQVDNTFYPPYFKNTIKFSSDDLTIDDKVNYLSFNYNNKVFYYFISSIHYISENLIELVCSLDSIQTFMFNINVSSGIIERKLIDRYVNYYNINRNYIRENVASKNIKLHSFVSYTGNYTKDWFLISRFSKKDKSEEGTNVRSESFAALDGLHDSSRNIFYENSSSSIKVTTMDTLATKNIPSESDINNITPTEVYAGNFLIYSYLEEYEDNYVCPFNPFYDLIIDDKNISRATSDYEWVVSKLNFNDVRVDSRYSDSNCYLTRKDDIYRLKIIKKTVDFEFSINRALSIPFKAQYCPVLLDNNYIKYTFGSRSVSTTYPLYMLTSCRLYPKYYFSIFSGRRIYYITSSSDNIVDNSDIYRTAVIDNNILSYDLKTNKWAQYTSANKFRFAQLAVDGVSTIATDMLKTPGYIGAAKGVADLATSGVQQAIKESNLLYAPSTIKSTGIANGSIAGFAGEIFSQIDYVDNFEECAQYYHRNGYLVNEYISNVGNNLFNYVNTRYYFNVLKFIDGDIHLDILSSSELINEINRRLSNGIRLWNVDDFSDNKITLRSYSIGDFRFDNVEKSVL